MAIIRDISERKRAEEALKASEEKYSTLVEKGNDGIVIMQDGLLKFVNSKMPLLGGYAIEEVIDKPFLDFISTEYRETMFERYHKRLSYNDSIPDHYEVEILSKDGNKIPVEVNPSVIEYGGKPAIMAIIRDIVERKKAETELKNYAEELKHSNELKDLFTDIMRHDLLNPAGIVKGYTDYLIGIEEDGGKLPILNKIYNNNEKLISIVESAAKFEKLESVDEIKFEKMNIGSLLKITVENFEPQLKQKKMLVEFKADGPYFARVNPVIEEAFSNLLSNAIKYGPEDSRIIMDIVDSGNDWKVTVTDFGEGIPDESKPQVFERFKRIDKRGVKGTGLGLAIVKRIVELHGGQVGVQDNLQGSGSVFWLTLKKM